MTYNAQIVAITDAYRHARQPWPATAMQISAWAIATKRWAPDHASLVKQFAHEIARAMREEYIVDPQGRTVRAKHAVRMTVGGRVDRALGRHSDR